jgi:hypothetical protein
MADQQANNDRDIIGKAALGLLAVWCFFLLLPWISLRWFPVKSHTDAERIKQTLGQYGTCGDLFGMLNCLFTGAAFIGAGYAAVLQNRQLRHQQKEIDEARIDREQRFEALRPSATTTHHRDKGWALGARTRCIRAGAVGGRIEQIHGQAGQVPRSRDGRL